MMKSLPLIFLISAFASVSAFDGEERDATGCPKAFKGLCHCGVVSHYKYWHSSGDIYMVNCTNTMFRDSLMLEVLPPETEVLIFVGNKIEDLDWNLFGIWDKHERLQVIDLSNNHIRSIAGKTFHKVSTVKRLLLDHNDLVISAENLHPRLFSNFESLEELHLTNAFTETIDSRWYLTDLKDIFVGSKMTKLRKLHLEQNEIWDIRDDDMFCDLKNLEELYLGDNQLRSFNFSLDCLEQLTYLSLEFNKIQRLSDKTLQKFDAVFASDKGKARHRTINLRGNPFRCDCHLQNFQRWLMVTNTSFFRKSELRCYDGYPEYNAGKQIMNVRQLDCPPSSTSQQSSSSSSSVTHALLVILIILVAIVGVLVVYYNRQKLHDSVKPLVVSFQKSMQYSTIDKEETEVPETNV